MVMITEKLGCSTFIKCKLNTSNNAESTEYSFVFWMSTKLCSNYRKLQCIGTEFWETKCDNDVNWFIGMVCQTVGDEKLLVAVKLTDMQMRSKK